MRIKCHRIVGGQAVGDAIITRQPINFLTMLNAGNGNITDQNHDLFGKSVKGTVLVFPKAIGSSVGAYTIYSLKSMNAAPVSYDLYRADGYNYCVRLCDIQYTISKTN